MKKAIRLLLPAVLLGLLAACAGLDKAAAPGRAGISSAALEFERVKSSPVELRMFLQRFPKGGDLHNHMSGAVYAEDFIEWALADGVCIELETMSAVSPPCDAVAGRPVLAAALAGSVVTRDEIIDAWSMRNFFPGYGAPSGHARFFRTFSLFSAAGKGRQGDMLAEVVRHAADQEIAYLELMISLEMSSARKLGQQVGPRDDLDALTDALFEAGIADLLPRAAQHLDALEEAVGIRFECPGSNDPACEVEVRFLAQVSRTHPPEVVFAQSLLGFLLVGADPRVVGLNLVAPEDNYVTLETYETQMRQLGFLARRLGPVPVSLHAGELGLGLVHPRHLRSHIRQAVEIAGASRIGHGVSIAYENNAEGLLMQMARERTAVEINLTSNDRILGISGNAHPFETYRAYGVPLVICTDDEGVSRGDLTHEFQRAVEAYDLTYDDILALSRNALTYAFVEGESLWSDPDSLQPAPACGGVRPGRETPDASCADFLEANRKARLQWRLEEKFEAFEADRAELRRTR